jgi:hypothetical protein
MKRKKQPLTLLEVMIALALTAILLGVIFGFYKQLFYSQTDIQLAKQRVLFRQWTQEKLTQVFSSILSTEGSDKEFYTLNIVESKYPALTFNFDNGVDRDPQYCDEVSGLLYLNKQHELRLVTWPQRSLILYSGVKSLSFSFFDAKNKVWKPEWKAEESLPDMVKVSLYEMDHPKDEIEFAYFLQTDLKITYPAKKEGS